MVWMREAEDGGQNSSNIDPRHGGSDKARLEAATMEVQGGARGEKWGRQQHPGRCSRICGRTTSGDASVTTASTY